MAGSMTISFIHRNGGEFRQIREHLAMQTNTFLVFFFLFLSKIYAKYVINLLFAIWISILFTSG